MGDYLLSIELRKADSTTNKVGEIVLLSQAWCNDVESAMVEYERQFLAGNRFAHMLRSLLDNPKFVDIKSIDADPRIKQNA
jgi:hypothetical protein